MNWWFRQVFIDRNTTITNAAIYDRQHPEIHIAENAESSLSRLFNWLKVRYREHLQARYDWKVYKNLSDHQLQDIGLTRDDLHLLLRNKTPLIPQQRLRKERVTKLTNPDTQLPRDIDLEKPAPDSGVICGNDCVERVA